MDEVMELAKRLEQMVTGMWRGEADLIKAAAALRSLQAENADLRERLRLAEKDNHAYGDRLAAAWREAAEHRAALKEIAHWSQADQDNHELCIAQWRGCVAIASQALEKR